MDSRNERSLGDIKRETEASRAQLTSTVEELRSTVTDTVADIKHQFSPATVKKEVGNYVRNRGETILNDMTEAARRNPMQAVAIGVGVAYPLLRIARAVPLPLALIGAGYFLAGTQRGRDLADSATGMLSDAADKTAEQMGSLREQASRSVSSAKGAATDAVAAVKDAMPFNTSPHTSPVDFDLRASASATATSMGDTLRQTAAEIPGRADDIYKTMRGTIQDAARQSGDVIQNNPLLVAGAGLLIGGLLASVIPKVRLEEDLLGDASAALRDRARQAVDQGFEQVKMKADRIVSDVAGKADEQGIGLDGISGAMKDIQHGLQRVAERGIDAALHRTQDNTGDNQTAKGSEHND
ncbi:MAG: Late embryosis abundant protein [Tardiphaga sp.]|nr:Late embryosis abundant protein [Tardiphaga sp.]